MVDTNIFLEDPRELLLQIVFHNVIMSPLRSECFETTQRVEFVLVENFLITAPFLTLLLTFTVQKGYNRIAQILIDNHADVNFQSNGGKNALMVAAYAGTQIV